LKRLLRSIPLVTMRIEKLHRLYVQELKSLYGWKMPSPKPAASRPNSSFDAYFVEAEKQARQLDRIFEWLGQPPVLPQLRTREET
jgi:hypothetical protein